MPGMRGLTIMVVTADPERFRGALTLACSHAALRARVRVYCHERAVSLLRSDSGPADPPDLFEHGLPDRSALLALAMESGVGIIACQTGLDLCGVAIGDVVPGVEAGGMMGVVATLGEDRLVTI
ncbi:MAG: peroxiredoxin [Sphingomonas sp.]|nr:peroxiredoxin [Sphingomonas sp.]